MTPPMLWRWPSVTCIRPAVDRRGGRAHRAAGARRRSAQELAAVSPTDTMIAFLRGRVIEKQPSRVIVDVAGVGYDVAVPLSTYYTAGDPGAEITLRIHTHVARISSSLYGFATALELDGVRAADRRSAASARSWRWPCSRASSRGSWSAPSSAGTSRLTRIPASARRPPSGSRWSCATGLPKALAWPGGPALPAARRRATGRTGVRARQSRLRSSRHRQGAGRGPGRPPDASFEHHLRAALKILSRG